MCARACSSAGCMHAVTFYLPNLAAVCIARDSSPEASGKLGSDRHYNLDLDLDLLPQIARQVLSSRPAGPARPPASCLCLATSLAKLVRSTQHSKGHIATRSNSMEAVA